MRLFKVLLVLSLVAASLASVLAADASAAPGTFVLLRSTPRSVGLYHFDVSASHAPGFGRTSFLATFTEHRRRADQSHTFSFDLPARTLQVADNLSTGSLRTGELATQGRPSDYGSVDMQFTSTGPAITLRASCVHGGTATLATRDGELTGSLEFDTGTVGLGSVGLGRLDASVSIMTVPRGCGLHALLTLLGGGTPIPSPFACIPGISLLAFSLRPDGRPAVLLADKMRVDRETFTLLTVDVVDPTDETAPATVDHSIVVLGPEGMFAASADLEHARVRGTPGRPFLSGAMGFTAGGKPKTHHIKKCDETFASGKLVGRLVAHFDVIGPVALTSVPDAFLSREILASGRQSHALDAAWRAVARFL